MHGFDVFRALALAGRAKPPEIVVVGREPAIMGRCAELSSPVAGALPRLVEAMRPEVGTRGRRPQDTPSSPRPDGRFGFQDRRTGLVRNTRIS